MLKHAICLSGGAIPWLGIRNIIKFAKECGFDGIELLPTRIVTKEFSNNCNLPIKDVSNIKSLHQNWRLDIGRDKKYRINFMASIFYTVLRYIFFPKPKDSQKILTLIANKLRVTTTIHEISDEWINNNEKKSIREELILKLLEIKR